VGACLHAGSTDLNVPSWGWWVSRNNMNERYWGGSAPDSGKCACGLHSECKTSRADDKSDYPCNCDAGRADDRVFDDGYAMFKNENNVYYFWWQPEAGLSPHAHANT